MSADFDWPDGKRRTRRDQLPAGEVQSRDIQWERPASKEEEFARAVPLALFDYLRKSHARVGRLAERRGRFVGRRGAGHLLVAAGGSELGLAGLAEKLPAWPRPNRITDLVGQLLTCVYQATRNSGATTRTPPRRSPRPSAPSFSSGMSMRSSTVLSTVSQAIGRELTWERDDVALQNIQARARSPGVWLLANLRGACCSRPATAARRRSATPRWTATPAAGSPDRRHRQGVSARLAPVDGNTGPAASGRSPALWRSSTSAADRRTRPPTAEQTDEGDLMPYGVLDAIERAAIRDKPRRWKS